MASSPALDRGESGLLNNTNNDSGQAAYRRVGLWNGLLIGMALVIGAWGILIISLIKVPVTMLYGSLVVAGILIVFLCGFAGWLSARIARAWSTILIWLATSFLCVTVMAFQSSWIRTFIIWLTDLGFWGRTIFPATRFPSFNLTFVALALAGFLIYLLVTVLAILQDGRLEGIQSALNNKGRLSGAAAVRLLLPLPFIALAGFITRDFMESADPAGVIPLVHEAIQTGRTYQGNLFELSLKEGLNYNAIEGVRDQMSANYELSLGEVDDSMSTTFVVAHFDNGTWINCRVLNGQLNFCYDASLPYTAGLSSLITGESLADDCSGCLPSINDDLANWLSRQGERFNGAPRITRISQRGSHVLMRAESPDGAAAVECWFEGNLRVRLVECMSAE